MYLSETAGYIPVTSLRNRPTGINAGYHIDGDIDGWRLESWDRDYSHRNRFNNTRVQRKFICAFVYNQFRWKKNNIIISMCGNQDVRFFVLKFYQDFHKS